MESVNLILNFRDDLILPLVYLWYEPTTDAQGATNQPSDENMFRALLHLAIFCTFSDALRAVPSTSLRTARTAALQLRGGTQTMVAEPPIAIVVDAEIEPSRVEEFIKIIEADALGSRNEPGCLRFDVLRASETRFFFYEAYKDLAAIDEHKAQPHFKLWSDFKASGGVVSSVSTKAPALGSWGFQGYTAGGVRF